MNTLELVRAIFSQPTAPFREHFVIEKIKALAQQKKLPYTFDSLGNLVVGVKSLAELKSGRRLLLFAHTDHPGFHVHKQNGTRLLARWYGGAPFKHMQGSKVRIYDPSLSQISHTGKIVHFEKGKYKRTGMKLEIELHKKANVAKGAFGAFDFTHLKPGYKIKNGTITSRAADDLAGCVIALGAVLDTRRMKGRTVAIFTRAEEVGYVGCWSFLSNTPVSKDALAISLEASRTLPGAELGKGPVLRLGDRSTLFDNTASQFMWALAQKLEKKNKHFKFQRRIMDGGSCEATALNIFGVRTTGLAVPLQNYHNQGSRKPEPEIVKLVDIENGRLMCAETAKYLNLLKKESQILEKTLNANFKRLSRLLGVKNKPSYLEVFQ